MIRILVGDCRERLKELASGSVQLCCTSPPYYNLRDYGVDGQLGLEPTPELYIEHLVEIFREVRRVLRDTGVLVLNLGDSYANDTKWGGRSGGKNYTSAAGNYQGQRLKRDTGLKPKDLMGIPWRVALALQADGWWLRSAMPWTKASAMPESVRDRPTNAHEYVFLLSRSARYFWDAEAIKQASSQSTLDRDQLDPNSGEYRDCSAGRNYRTTDLFNASLDIAIEQQRAHLAHLEHVRENGGLMLDEQGNPIALKVNTAGFAGAHFAVFPTELVEPFVRAGTSEKGQCPECGAAWERVVEKDGTAYQDTGNRKRADASGATVSPSSVFRTGTIAATTTTGWRPTCSCSPAAPVVPQTVLDPFGGAMTTMLVTDRLQRNGIACELNADYAEMGRERLKADGGMFTQVAVE